ncbi:MAG: 1-phosphofructokinase family hexose kinase [Acidobacteria bacterium]|nr:1-phosphofructokinase family hexose kinase [Acidobacteriota bacterium]
MILTLTINPAIDRTVMADRLAFEDRGYILSTSESAGGRGLNASRVIHSFGGKTLAVVTAGGKLGNRFEQLLGECSFPVEVVRIREEIRTNLTISDKQGLTVKLNEAGPKITAKELDRIAQAVEKKIGKADWLMLCGSIPPGVDPHFYCELIKLAAGHGVRTLLDTDGDALLHGLESRPAVVSPNQSEAERLLNRALITRQHFLDAAERLYAMGAQSVMLSLGSRGAVARDASGLYEVVPPRVDAVCPIGAGDALSAAFVWAMSKKHGFPDAVRWGVAAGTASARLPGFTFASLAQTREVYDRVEVREVKLTAAAGRSLPV